MKNEGVRIKAILFDLDGTIFDITERDAFARYEALKKLGHDVSLDYVRKHCRNGAGREGILEELGIKFTEKETTEYVEASFAFFTESENARKLTRIQPKAYDVLRTLFGAYRLVLVTSRSDLSSTEEELGWFGIRSFFTSVITRDVAAEFHGVKHIRLLPFQEQRTKLYTCAIGLTKIDPKEMLCIGDSVGELEPAKKLGMRTIGVLTGFSSKEEMEQASISTIRDLADLPKIVKELNTS